MLRSAERAGHDAVGSAQDRALRRAAGRSLLAVLIALLALAQGEPVAGASVPRMQRVPAQFAYIYDNSNGCTWGIGVDFPAVSRATSYQVTYWDGYYKQVITSTALPSQLGTDLAAGRGTLFLGVTGGGYSPPCAGAGDPTENGRFSKGATVLAILPGGSIVVSGRVTKCTPTVSGCIGPRPQSGVEVTARRKGGSVVTAFTGPDGVYRMALAKKGLYTFTPHDAGFNEHGAITNYTLGARTLDIRGDRSGVDFAGYSSSDVIPPPSGPFVNAPPGTLAAIVEIKARDSAQPTVAFVQRGGTGPVTPLRVGDTLQKGDVVGTDGNTLLALELALGGRVGVNSGSEVQLTGERTVGSTTTDSFKLSKGGMWARCGELKEPLEIQTNGGVMGIKG
jgi:hypothetical protein